MINESNIQRQKITFMRGIIKETEIIIIDEFIQKVISKLKDKTVIMIIHNLEILRHFNKVIYFGNKTLTEALSFRELLIKNLLNIIPRIFKEIIFIMCVNL